MLLLVPSLNPDGQIMVTEWYRKYVGTKYEGGRLPWLYHHYIGHDNNRDWYMLTQLETRALNRAVYHEWNPQVFVDEHQMESEGPRMFIPPFADPVDPDVHPLIWREVNMHRRKHGLPPGAGEQERPDLRLLVRRLLARRHAQHRLVEEHHRAAARDRLGAHRVAGLHRADRAPRRRQGARSSTRPTINHPNPWKGGWWRMRDIMDYERIASDALHEIAADRREDLLRNLAHSRARGNRACEAGRGISNPATSNTTGRLRSTWRGSWPSTTSRCGRRRTVTTGSRSPSRTRSSSGDDGAAALSGGASAAGKEILRPYDVATLDAAAADGRARGARADARTARRAVTKIRPETKEVDRARRKACAQAARGHYKPWPASMDEGWTRWVLDTYGLLRQGTLAAGNRRRALSGFDAVILPDIPKDDHRHRPPEAVRRPR